MGTSIFFKREIDILFRRRYNILNEVIGCKLKKRVKNGVLVRGGLDN